MLKETFLGKTPSDFHINPVVKAFIISEIFLWSAWNFITPIFAIFAATKITGGNIEIAGSAYSMHLVTRVIFELITGKYVSKSSEYKKFLITILALIILSISYLGFALTNTIANLFIFYSVAGIGLGIASPVKNSLFAMHLDKNKETTEWGIYDGVVFTGMALSAALGGFIANKYGFGILFYLAATINFLSIIPYVLYIRHNSHRHI